MKNPACVSLLCSFVIPSSRASLFISSLVRLLISLLMSPSGCNPTGGGSGGGFGELWGLWVEEGVSVEKMGGMIEQCGLVNVGRGIEKGVCSPPTPPTTAQAREPTLPARAAAMCRVNMCGSRPHRPHAHVSHRLAPAPPTPPTRQLRARHYVNTCSIEQVFICSYDQAFDRLQ